jgi:hypothetical protein
MLACCRFGGHRDEVFKPLDFDFSRKRNDRIYWPYQIVCSRSTDFVQVGLEPEQVPTGPKTAFFLSF